MWPVEVLATELSKPKMCRGMEQEWVKSTIQTSGYSPNFNFLLLTSICMYSCTGREASLEVCRKSTDVSKCDHSDDVGIECNVPECSNCPLDYNVSPYGFNSCLLTLLFVCVYR